MGLVANLASMNTYGKKQCRNLFWRMRAAVKKAMKDGRGGKQQLKFHYDPSSYALNFDDGCCHLGQQVDAASSAAKFQDYCLGSKGTTTLVYVFLVKASY